MDKITNVKFNLNSIKEQEDALINIIQSLNSHKNFLLKLIDNLSEILDSKVDLNKDLRTRFIFYVGLNINNRISESHENFNSEQGE